MTTKRFEIEFEMFNDQYLAIGEFSKWSRLEVGTVDENGQAETISTGGIKDIEIDVLEKLTDEGGISVLGNVVLEDIATDKIIEKYDK